MTWNRLQSASATTGSGNTLGVAYTSNLSAGTTLMALVSTFGFTAQSITDTAGNNFVKIGAVLNDNTAADGETSLWALGTPAGDVGTKPTITVSWGATNTNSSGILILEVAGLVPGASLAALADGTAATTFGLGSSTVNAPAYTTSIANEFLAFCYGDPGFNQTWTTPSGYTADPNSLNTNGLADLAVFYKNSTGGTESGSFTTSPNNADPFGVIMVAFQLPQPNLTPSPPWVTPLSSRFGPAVPFAQPPLLMQPPAAGAAPTSVPPSRPPPVIQHPAPHRTFLRRAGACAAGILAATTLSPQPTSVPPSRPAPVIQHPAPHRATAKGQLRPPQLPFTTAKLPPTAISPRPPHRFFGKGILAKTTFSPQPTVVFPLPQPVPIRRPGPHRVLWKAVAGPAPTGVTPGVSAPARPLPVIAHPAPHRATGKGILAKTTLSAQPTSVPPARPQLVIVHLPPHRAIAKGIAGLPAPLAPPSRPQPVIQHPAPHRAVIIPHGIAATTSLSPQPTSVPPPKWQQPNAPRPPHRVIWRFVAGPPPSVVTVSSVPPARPLPTVNRPPAPHRALGKGILAKTTLSAQPSSVPAPQWRPQPRSAPPHRAVWRAQGTPAQQPFLTAKLPPTAISFRPAHRVAWRAVAGPGPAVVVVTAVAPARPLPTVNRPPAPHRAIGKGILATTTLSAQPAFVPAPHWRPQPRFVPPHRAAWRVVFGPPVVPVISAPARPAPTTNRPPPPHRAIGKGVLAKTTLSAQPAFVPAPHYPPVIQHLPPHRVIWHQQVVPSPGVTIQSAHGSPRAGVTDPRDGPHTLTGASPGASVTDPRDAGHTLAGPALGTGVTDPRDAPHTVT